MANCPSCFSGTPLWQLYDVTDNNPEFCLYESVVSEFTDIAGFPIMYYRAKSKMDRLYGEDANQDYYTPIKTKLIYEPSEETNIIDGLGIRSDETLQYASLPKANFARDVGKGNTTLQPMAGDVIKTLWNNRNYEIVDIGAEQNIFMARKLIWEFILRPFRFSEQSDMADQIHRSTIGWTQIYLYPYPDNDFMDVTYPDGTQAIKIPIDSIDLGINFDALECGYTYKKNPDGSVDILQETLVIEDDQNPHPIYENTNKILEDNSVNALGDNVFIEQASDNIDPYDDVDSYLFSRAKYDKLLYGISNSTTLTQSKVDSFSQLNIIPNQTQDLTYTPVNDYLYILVPYTYLPLNFTVGGFVAEFMVSDTEYVINNDVVRVSVYRTQYKQVTSPITVTVQNIGRK
jgi:hypothetical protein